METTIEKNLYRRKQMGQSVVELALITPLLLVALYIPADFGVAFLTAHLVQNAVREGARIGSGLTSGDPSKPIDSGQGITIKDAVFARLPQRLSSPSVSVKFYFAGEAATCMQVVEVTITGNYDFGLYHLMGLIGVTVPPSEPIVEQLKCAITTSDLKTILLFALRPILTRHTLASFCRKTVQKSKGTILARAPEPRF